MVYATLARYPVLVRRLGKAALIFFLMKGLLWLAAPLVFLWVT